ncbi:MAG TPA: cupin domain-containing protein [Micromonosporaceae bacterium]
MEKFSLDASARELLARAERSSAGRGAETLYGGHEHVLRQTVIAMRAGAVLEEHENPGEATLIVLRGRVELVAPHASWTGQAGDLLVLPQARHEVTAVTDSALLLTVAKLP